MKIIAAAVLLSAVTSIAMAGASYDDELLKRKSGYGDAITFDDSNAAQVDLSRGVPVVNRVKPESEVATEDALVKLEQAKEILKEAEVVRKQAETEYKERMSRLAREEDLARKEYLARIEDGNIQKDQIVKEGHAQVSRLVQEVEYSIIHDMIDPIKVRNKRVDVNVERGTIKEIALELMPKGWRVKTDFSRKPELNHKQFTFTTTDPRDYALQALCASVRDVTVTYQYFFDLADNGRPTPMLLISDRKIY